MSTARYGREKILPGKVGKNNLPGKIVYGTSLPYWVGLQGLTTREVGLGAIDTEGGGRLRAQRVSEACLVPVRKGRGLEGENIYRQRHKLNRYFIWRYYLIYSQTYFKYAY